MERPFVDKVKPWQVSILVGILGAVFSAGWSFLFDGYFYADSIYKPMAIGMPMSYLFYRSIWKNRNLLRTANQQLEEALEKITLLSRMDSLTGLLNRGAFFEGLEAEIFRNSRYGHSLAFVMMDLDYFKQINDNYGHQAGDEIIRKVAEVLREELRNVDLVGRIGGEEFALLLVETDADAALQVCERIRLSIEKLKFKFNTSSHSVGLTVSIGYWIMDSSTALTSKELYSAADKCLYAAKESGRNRVCNSFTVESSE